jgi:hypothetical protein
MFDDLYRKFVHLKDSDMSNPHAVKISPRWKDRSRVRTLAELTVKRSAERLVPIGGQLMLLRWCVLIYLPDANLPAIVPIEVPERHIDLTDPVVFNWSPLSIAVIAAVLIALCLALALCAYRRLVTRPAMRAPENKKHTV